MEFANRLAKYEPDALDSASQPRQGPDALGRQSADLQLGHAWVIKVIYATKVIFRKVYSLQMQWSSTSTHPDSHCCRAVENLSVNWLSPPQGRLYLVFYPLPHVTLCHHRVVSGWTAILSMHYNFSILQLDCRHGYCFQALAPCSRHQAMCLAEVRVDTAS